jgi:hypothetical protein
VQFDMKETLKETHVRFVHRSRECRDEARLQLEFTTRTVCRLAQVLGGCGAKRGGLQGGACTGRGRTSCDGGERSREPCATTLTVARSHACLELLLRLHVTHLAIMGKKQDGWQAAWALSGVPSDSVACDNLVWLY